MVNVIIHVGRTNLILLCKVYDEEHFLSIRFLPIFELNNSFKNVILIIILINNILLLIIDPANDIHTLIGYEFIQKSQNLNFKLFFAQ